MTETTLAYHVTPARYVASHKQGRLASHVTKEQITQILGVKPGTGDPDKTTAEWNFIVEKPDGTTVECAIWDYKGVRWSTFGPSDVLHTLFGAVYTPDSY